MNRNLFLITMLGLFSCGIACGGEGLEITKIGKPATWRVRADGKERTIPGKAVEVRIKNHDKDWSGRIRIVMMIYDRDKNVIHTTEFFRIDSADTKYFDSTKRSIKGRKQVSVWHRFTEGFCDRYDPKYYEVNILCDGERQDRKTNPSSFLEYLEEQGIDLAKDIPALRKRRGR